VQPGACKPGADREFAVPEDPHGSADTQAFGPGAKNLPHATGRDLEAIEDRAIADTEFRLTSLALKILDVFLATVAAVADEGVDLFIDDSVVQAVGVGTGIPGGRDPFLAERATRAFYL
jgi:hypothetical protein